MGRNIIDSYNDFELKKLIADSTSLKDLARRMGYTHGVSGDTIKKLRKRVENFDTSHFKTYVNQGKFEQLQEKDIFQKGHYVANKTVRKHYKDGNYSEYKCSICGQLPVWNGQDLTLILDHKNGDNSDHRLQNLRWVCPNCNQQLPTTGSRNPNRKIHKKIWICKDCGVEIFKGGTRCKQCEAKRRIMTVDVMRVSREELKTLIRTLPFLQIGEKFNVSDNTIRKWCDKYNLPRKASEIKKYSDEEWKLI